jgi:hypothetical protein
MLSESIRSTLFTICILGVLFTPFWYIGTTIVCVSLRNVPESASKAYMSTFAWFSNIFIVVFWATFIPMCILGVGRTGGGSHGPIPEFASGAQAVVGIGVPVWIILAASYFYFADATFRGAFGPLKTTLTSPLVLRGVHLATNVSSLLFPPLVFVGVPLVLWKLSDAPKHPARRALTVVGALSIVSLVLFAIVIAIVASTSTTHISMRIIDEDLRCINEQEVQLHMGQPTTNTCQMRTSGTFHQPGLSASLYAPFSPGTLVVALILLAHVICQLTFTIAADRVILKAIESELAEQVGSNNGDGDEFHSARDE